MEIMFKENRMAYLGENAGKGPGQSPEWHAPMALPESKDGQVDDPKLKEIRTARTDMSGDLATMMKVEQSKGDKTLEAMRVLGISQEKLDEILNDGTNPYVNWAVEFLGTFGKGGLVLEKAATKKNGRFTFKEKGLGLQFNVSNLDRVFMWKETIYPELLKIVGSNNYAKYEKAIWDATEGNAPRMNEWLRRVCGSRMADPNLPRAVRAELEQLRRGKTVAQLKNEEARSKKVDDRLNGLGRKLVPIELDDSALAAFAKNFNSGIDTKGMATVDRIEDLKREKYSEIIEEKNALVQHTTYADNLSLEDYTDVNSGLDRLLNDTLDKVEDSEMHMLNKNVNDFIPLIEKMAANGASMNEIESFIESTGLDNKYKFDGSDSSGADLSMLKELWHGKFNAIASYYDVK